MHALVSRNSIYLSHEHVLSVLIVNVENIILLVKTYGLPQVSKSESEKKEPKKRSADLWPFGLMGQTSDLCLASITCERSEANCILSSVKTRQLP